MRNTGKQREPSLAFDRTEIDESSYQQIRSPEKLRGSDQLYDAA